MISRYSKTLIICCVWGIIAFSSTCKAQETISFILVDKLNKAPIENVHVFFDKSTIGTTSSRNGKVKLEYSTRVQEDLFISHLAYDLKILPFKAISNIKNNDTLKLTPTTLELANFVVTSESNKKRRRYLKRFERAFFGNVDEARHCSILNPDVIQFTMKDGVLTATASDMILINNKYLGYEIKYLLTKLIIETNGSITYSGRSIYKDLENPTDDRVLKNRKRTYNGSLRHFLKALIDDKLKKEKYRMYFATNEKDYLKVIKPLKRQEVLAYDTINNVYHLYFPDFLKVTNGKVKVSQTSIGGMSRNGLEDLRFNSGDAGARNRLQPVTSYLFKVSNTLRIDQYGHLLNTEHLKEYGYWAQHKIALTLPYDYNLSSESESESSIAESVESERRELLLFDTLLYQSNIEKRNVLSKLESSWKEEYIPLLIEYLRFAPDPGIRKEVATILEKRTKKNFNEDFFGWVQWCWQSEIYYPNYYADFKALLYRNIDKKFEQYFLNRSETAEIQLDEIVWGGVKQDGIPPLRYPTLTSVQEANYLNDNDIIYGISIDGIHKAYPKRILAWHEMVVDKYGNKDIAVVYCTLCGTVIAYDMRHRGTLQQLGTSGFLYRSNKLMYDKATQSLWNTIEGKPVLGPLVKEDIELSSYPVVTTTWKDWKEAHPDTEVLSLDTGHKRNYNEGEAYRSYFATDDLMFPVPLADVRLKNKDHVYVLSDYANNTDPVAISTKYLKRKKWLVTEINNSNILFLTTRGGAIRAYNIQDHSFKNYKNQKLYDTTKQEWTITEKALKGPNGESLNRIAGHEIFWFAWLNTHPQTRLVK